MTPIHKRELPDGYCLGELITTTWRVGHVFRWSEVYEAYLDESHRITVRPRESVGAAYAREADGGSLVRDKLDVFEREVFFRVE